MAWIWILELSKIISQLAWDKPQSLQAYFLILICKTEATNYKLPREANETSMRKVFCNQNYRKINKYIQLQELEPKLQEKG